MNRKKIVLLCFCLLLGFGKAEAQWQSSGSDLYFNSGNIGIGISSPNRLLDVDGTVDLNDKDGLKTNNIINVNELNVRDISSNRGVNPIHFTQPFVVETGNVGIGTVNPSSPLTVNGIAKAEEIVVEENVGADFVFGKDYNLPTLSEVEQHILNQKHLPEIPTAEEMKKHGVEIGGLQMKLLQKIEELTLYVIELKKENEKLENRIQELEKNKK